MSFSRLNLKSMLNLWPLKTLMSKGAVLAVAMAMLAKPRASVHHSLGDDDLIPSPQALPNGYPALPDRGHYSTPYPEAMIFPQRTHSGRIKNIDFFKLSTTTHSITPVSSPVHYYHHCHFPGSLHPFACPVRYPVQEQTCSSPGLSFLCNRTGTA